MKIRFHGINVGELKALLESVPNDVEVALTIPASSGVDALTTIHQVTAEWRGPLFVIGPIQYEWIEFPVSDAFSIAGRGVAIPVPVPFEARFVFGTYVNVEIRGSGVKRAAIVEAARHPSGQADSPVLVVKSLSIDEVLRGTSLRVEVRAA